MAEAYFPNYENYETAIRNGYSTLNGAADDNMEHTWCYTAMTRMVDGAPFLRRITKANNVSEKLSIIGEYEKAFLRQCAPRRDAYWMLNRKFLSTGLEIIAGKEYEALSGYVVADVRSTVCTINKLNEYKIASKEFRREMEAKGVLSENMRRNQTEVNQEVRVNSAAMLSTMKDMIMEKEENERKRLNRISGEDSQANYSQDTHIDILFNFFLFLRSSGIINSLTGDNQWISKSKLNSVLYVLGQKILGKQKLSDMLTNFGYSTLSQLFNNTGSRNQPPYCLNYERVYTCMVAVFGVLKISNLNDSMMNPGVAPNYFIHCKLSSRVALLNLIHLYIIERHAFPESRAEKKSIRYMNQILINKTHELQNSTGEEENYFNFSFHVDFKVQPI